MNSKNNSSLTWLSRFLIGTVTFLNLQAAVYFLFSPQDYVAAFELTGEPGAAVIRGMGLLFLMWNIPYIIAVIHPIHHFLSLIEAVVMQGIGVFGEMIILFTLPGVHPQIHASVVRFILFDGGGLVLLLLSMYIIGKQKTQRGIN
jgi:hypothetical protein